MIQLLDELNQESERTLHLESGDRTGG
jgi:hypothetical protein